MAKHFPSLINEVADTVERLKAEPALAHLGQALAAGLEDLRAAKQQVLEQGKDPEKGPDAYRVMRPLLNLAGHVLCAWQMGQAALSAEAAIAR